MSAERPILNSTVTAFLLAILFSLPLSAETGGRLEALYAELKQAEPVEAQRIAKEIQLEQSKSGSAAMDLLLKRGRDAMEAGDLEQAIEHLTALTDHAPDFADGWHTRAIAYARAGLYGPALADIERALALNPRHFDAIASLGALLEEVGHEKLAHDAYTQVLAIHPYFEDVTTALERLDAEFGGSEI
nr:tetratricopeptide repeat protein [uncultured Roseovarius sp.]